VAGASLADLEAFAAVELLAVPEPQERVKAEPALESPEHGP
jgi:hypothetical protein